MFRKSRGLKGNHGICEAVIPCTAFEEEIRQGFITIQGGHRVGALQERLSWKGTRIKSVKYISYINLRLSHQIKAVLRRYFPILSKTAGSAIH